MAGDSSFTLRALETLSYPLVGRMYDDTNEELESKGFKYQAEIDGAKRDKFSGR